MMLIALLLISLFFLDYIGKTKMAVLPETIFALNVSSQVHHVMILWYNVLTNIDEFFEIC
jgi:hypothetical protein